MIYVLATVTMTFLGCGDSLEDCEFISQSNVTYKSKAQCEEAIPPLLVKMTAENYPVVTGHCSAEDNQTVVTATPLPPASSRNDTTSTAIIVKTGPSQPTPLAPIDLGRQNATNSSDTQNDATQKKPLARVITRIENGFASVRTGTSNLLNNIGQRTRNGLNKLAVGLRLKKEQPVQ